jgi:hypothetical protein
MKYIFEVPNNSDRERVIIGLANSGYFVRQFSKNDSYFLDSTKYFVEVGCSDNDKVKPLDKDIKSCEPHNYNIIINGKTIEWKFDIISYLDIVEEMCKIINSEIKVFLDKYTIIKLVDDTIAYEYIKTDRYGKMTLNENRYIQVTDDLVITCTINY